MIYRLRYCNKDGVEARVDIQKGSATPIIEVEGTERPFVLSYNNDKGNKSGMFLSSSADIEIYETPDFNIDNLKTSNETELSVTHYIDNVVSWQGFIIPDFFSIEVRNNPVITMTASDRLGTLKNVTLSDLPSTISLRELAVLCLNKTGLELTLRTMADFNNGTGINDFFNSKILTQRLSDTKGRSISCYDILSSILTASNSFLVQRLGAWHIINKIQHEAGSGKLYTDATLFINWSDVIFNFSDISIGGRRTIIPVASTVGVFHEFGGSKTYPSNYDFKDGASGWTVNFPEEMEARFDNRNILGFDVLVSGGGYQPVYGTETNNPHMVVYGFRGSLNYVKSEDIVVPTGYGTDVEIKFDINASAPIWNFGSFQRMAVFAVKDTETKALVNGSFVPLNEVTESQYMNRINFEQGPVYVGELARVATESFGVSGKLSDAEGLDGYTIHIRLYSSDRAYATVINFATINFAPVGEMAKGNLYKTERTDNYTKAHDIDTSIFADYITYGLNGYFYRYAIDDTSSLYNSANELTTRWTAYNDTEQLPLLQHVTRQRSRLFSVAHDLLSAEVEVNDFDPLAIFVACGIRHTVVSAQFDFFKSNLSVELEEVAFEIASARDFIYSYFGDGEEGIKSIGGISGSAGGGGATGGGLTPEQLEVLSFWKKDPENPDTIFTEMNAYSTKELSAYGVGDGEGGGDGGDGDGSDYERLDTWASYDSSRAGWVLSAFLGNDLNTRVTNLENSGGDGSVTSVGISVPTGLSVSNSPITSSGVIAIGLQAGYSIPTTAKQGQWDAVVTDFGNLEIGGRNLFQLNDAPNRLSDRFTLKNVNNNYIGLRTLKSSLEIGKTYTFFSKIKYETIPTSAYSSGSVAISVNSNYEGVLVSISIPDRIRLENGETIEYRGTFTLDSKDTEDFMRGYTPLYGSTRANAIFIEPKLVEGDVDKKGDWTPAPEDQVSDWNITDVNSFSFIKNKPTLLSQFTDNIGVATHIANTSNPHSVTKAQVGLGNVDNTSDLLKPISNATQAALNLKLDKSVFDDLFEKVEVSTGVFAIKAKYNFYGVGEVSAYGIGSGGGGGGGGIIDTVYGYGNLGQTFNNNILTDTFNAYTINQINTRLVSVENGSALTVNTTGTGNAITSISKAGSVITANKDLTFSLSGHTHTISDITNLQTTLNNKLETSIFNTHNNDNVRHITGAERTKWDGVVTDFAELEIGGRNYISNNPTNWEQGYFSLTTGAETVNAAAIRTKGYIEINSESLTVSMGDLDQRVNLFFFNSNKEYISNSGWRYADEGDTYTIIVPSGAKYVRMAVGSRSLNYPTPSTMSLWKIKLEKGNKATDWTPAPEDLEIGGRNYISGNGNHSIRASRFINIPLTVPLSGQLILSTSRSIVQGVAAYSLVRLLDSAGNAIQASPVPSIIGEGFNSITFSISTLAYTLEIYAGVDFAGSNGVYVDLTKLKLEKGNKATDWTPAPEDQVSDWLTTDINSFSFIKNKPTTLAGYGITDAVTLNTAQTITGEKTFSGNVIIKGAAGISPLKVRGIDGYIDNTGLLDNLYLNFVSTKDILMVNGGGNIGIGTLSPTQKLHVAGNILATGTTTTTKVIFNAAGWSMEQVGSELQMKHNNVLKMRFTSAGSIVATEEITAHG